MQHPLRSSVTALLAAGAALSTVGLAQQPVRVSVNSAGEPGNLSSFSPAISADGRHVVFASEASNLVANDTNNTTDVFVRDVVAGTTTRVSVATGGGQGDSASGIPHLGPYDLRRVVSISADGARVAFISIAGNFAPGATVGVPQIYVHDRATGTTAIASRTPSGSAPANGSVQPFLSGDGRFVFFLGAGSELVPGGVSNRTDLFAFDVAAGTVSRVFAPPTFNGLGAWVDWCSSSTNGRHLAFVSVSSTNPGYQIQVMLFDRDADGDGIYDEPGSGTSARVLANSDLGFETPDLSSDGRFVVWQDGSGNVRLRDRDSDEDGTLDENGTTTRIVAHVEAEGSSWPYQLAVSADGRWLGSFERVSGRYTLDDMQLFLRDMRRGASHLVSRTASGAPASMHTRTGTIALTPDAAFVAFDSLADNLVPTDTNGYPDVFLAARPSGTAPGDAVRYCTTTTGPANYLTPHIGYGGSTSVSAGDLVLKAYETPVGGVFGRFMYGPVAASVPFGNGYRCVGPGALGIFRLPLSPVDVWGYPTFPFPFGGTPAGGAISAGSSWCFQYWFRDQPPGSLSFDLTEGLRLVFGP